MKKIRDSKIENKKKIVLAGLLALGIGAQWAMPAQVQAGPTEEIKVQEHDKAQEALPFIRSEHEKSAARLYEAKEKSEALRRRIETGLKRMDVAKDSLELIEKRYKGDTLNLRSLRAILVEAGETTSSVKRGIAADYLYLMDKGGGFSDPQFKLDPQDIVSVMGSEAGKIKSWSESAQENFHKVISRAAELIKTGKAPTADVAFRDALKENGLLETFLKGCQR